MPQTVIRRVGLFGGTFDPPHVGHLVTAVNVRHALNLEVVVLMVAHDPWQKSSERGVTRALDRLALVEAAVSNVEGLVAGRDEIDRGGPSFTADTLQTMSLKYPDAQLFTIVGDDAAAGLPTWERVESPRLEVSSTDLRARFTDGRPLDYLVTAPVLAEIEKRGLYGSGGRIS